MSVYLDASVLHSLVVNDAHSAIAFRWLATSPAISFSTWTVTEVSSAFSHHVRMETISSDEREAAEGRLDRWVSLRDLPLNVLPEDFHVARRFIRLHRLLRAPDALHMTVAARNGLAIATFDQRLRQAAAAQGLETVNFENFA